MARKKSQTKCQNHLRRTISGSPCFPEKISGLSMAIGKVEITFQEIKEISGYKMLVKQQALTTNESKRYVNIFVHPLIN